MRHYRGDDRMMIGDYERPARLDLSEEQPFTYAEFDCSVSRDIDFHMHYAMELGMVIQGAMERFTPEGRVILRSGDVWLNSLLEPHSWRVSEPSTRIGVFHILPEFLAALFFQEAPGLRLMAPFTVPPAARPHTTDLSRPQILDVAARLRAVPETPLKVVRVRLLLEELLVMLEEQWVPPARKAQTRESFGRVASAVELVFESPGYLTTTQAAKACGLSRNRFHQLFMECMGISFADFALRHRLSNAARELRRSREPVKAIASRWGFADVSHFHRLFSELYRCAPGVYRKEAIA